jgi:hypothetical protein
MSNFESDGSAGSDGDDRGELAWNEFDWERYLREQDEAVLRYLGFYEGCRGTPDRIDAVAAKMDWSGPTGNDETDPAEDSRTDDDESDFGDDGDVYTLYQNPIFIATRAIYLGLNRTWVAGSPDPTRVPQRLAVAMQVSFHRGEDQAVQAIQALDYGDYAMAVSLFKRALDALNVSLALVADNAAADHPWVQAWSAEARTRFFDLREIWLRVMGECREELRRPIDDET